MNDLLLSEAHDLVIENNDFILTDSQNVVGQRIKQNLLTFLGEWFLDIEVGLPFFEEILGKGKSLARIESLYIRAIGNTEGVQEITEFDLDYNSSNRKLTVTFSVIDDADNEINIVI